MAATTAPVRRSRLEGTEIVTLAAGELEASFAPHLGMAGVSLLHRGVELLDRRAGLAEYAERGAVMGIPLLHPWANRLDAHGFTLDDRDIRLPSGPPLVRCEEHGLPIPRVARCLAALGRHVGWRGAGALGHARLRRAP